MAERASGLQDVRIRAGLAPAHRDAAAALYWQAFAPKLGRVMGPERRALAYLGRVLRPDQAISALDEGGALIGLAGYRTPSGAFAHGNRHDMVAIYGSLGAAWRGAVWRLVGAEAEPWRFLIEGLCVQEGARGQGIGSALIEALCTEARIRGHREVRLEVSHSNPRARALYERAGFVAAGEERLRMLGPLFGTPGSTRMVRRLS